MAKERIVSFRLTEDEYRNLVTVAKHRGLKVSDLIRNIVTKESNFFAFAYSRTQSLTIDAAEVKWEVWNA